MERRFVVRLTALMAVTAGTAVSSALLTRLSPAAAVSRTSEGSEEIETVQVFERNESGYSAFRIPAVVQAPDGTVLAFAEGRVESASDDGNIDIVVKRSSDGGATWGDLAVIWSAGVNKAGNPVPVVDQSAGRIILDVTRTSGRVTSEDIRNGDATAGQSRRPFILHSDDNGATWSDPREITDQIKPDDWRHFVGGPGHAIQLTQGAHAGRLVIAGNHSVAPPEGSGLEGTDNSLYGAHCRYSDDGGTTWHLGAEDTPLTGVINPNEGQVAELEDGTLYFNVRDHHGSSSGNRAATTSSDGGASFDHPYEEVTDLTTPVVQGSVLRLSAETDEGERLVFSAPGSADSRVDLTLSTSTDEGGSWQGALLLHEGPAGYSDLIDLGTESDGTGTLGVLFENGDDGEDYYQRISFARIPVAEIGVGS